MTPVKGPASWVTRRRIQYAVVVAGVAAALLDVLAAILNRRPDAQVNLLVYTPVEILVGWTFLFVGLVAARRRPDNPVGLLMSVFGLTWFAFALEWIRSPVPFELGTIFVQFYLGVVGHLYIVYPGGRPAGRLERRSIAGVYAWFAFTAIKSVTDDPIGAGCSQCVRNPFYVPGTSWLNPVLVNVSSYGTVVLAVFVLAIFALHWRRASAPVRRAMAPAAWA